MDDVAPEISEEALGTIEQTIAAVERGDDTLRINFELTDADALRLFHACRKSTATRQIIIAGAASDITPVGAEILGLAFAESTSLNTLLLGGVYITDDCVSAFARGAAACTSLRHLGFINSRMTDMGVAALCALVEKQTALKNFVLVYNLVTIVGVEALARALGKSTTLKALALVGDRITDAGTEILTRELKASSALTQVLLSENAITDVGAAVLARWVETSTSLVALDVQDNRMSGNAELRVELAVSGACTCRALLGVVDLLREDGDHALAWRIARFLV